MHVAFAAGARDRLGLQSKHAEIVGELAASQDRIEPFDQFGILRRDAGRVVAFVPVVIGAGGGAELAILILKAWDVIAEATQRGAAVLARAGAGAPAVR